MSTNPYEEQAREAKAHKLAAYLQGKGLFAWNMVWTNQACWDQYAKKVGVRSPSRKTQLRVVMIMAEGTVAA